LFSFLLPSMPKFPITIIDDGMATNTKRSASWSSSKSCRLLFVQVRLKKGMTEKERRRQKRVKKRVTRKSRQSR
jgi:hypothetical protein